MKFLMSLAMLCVALCLGARAATTDEILTLSQKGVGEDVLLAAVENSATGFNMGAADILKLKDAKVSDKVIMAMLKRKNTGESAVAQPRVHPPAAPRLDSPATDNRDVAGGEGVLNIENVDERMWSYKYEPDTKTIWIDQASRDGRGNLSPHAGMSLRMKAGTYTVRYGKEPGFQVTVFDNERSQLMISRVDTQEMEALYVSVYEKGEKKASGKLANLRAARSEARPESRVEAQDRTVVRDDDDYERVVVEERYVERPTVIYRESPTYIYPSYPRYYSSGYYGSYYSRPSFNFGFSTGGSHHHHNHGHRSGGSRGGVRYGYR